MAALRPCIQVVPVSRAIGLLVSLSITTWGCAGPLHTQRVVVTDSDGTVTLEEVVDWSYEASHPISLDASVVTRALQGLHVGAKDGPSAYTPEDINFLAPNLATALSKAKPEHFVSFLLTSAPAAQRGVTGGTLYVKGPSLYITPRLSHTDGRMGPAGESQSSIAFEPSSVARTQKAFPDTAFGHASLSSVVIDYRALASLPVPAPAQTIVRSPASPFVTPQIPAPPTVTPPIVRAPTPTVSPMPASTPAAVNAQTKESQNRPTASITVKKSKPKASPKPSVKTKAAATQTVKPTVETPSTLSTAHKGILELLKKSPNLDTAPALK